MKLILALLSLTLIAPTAFADAVSDALKQIPAPNSAAESAIAAKLFAGGPTVLKELLATLVPLGTPGKDDTATRDAVSALVRHAGRAGGETDRATLAQALSEALSSATDTEIRTFLINRLQEVAHDEAIPALTSALADEKLLPHAAAALERIGSPAAIDALNKALPTAIGTGRVALIKSLGMLGATTSADEIRKSATDGDKTLRMTALWALANIGDPSAAGLLDRALETATGDYDQSRLYAWTLLHARRLAEAGNAKDAVARCTRLLEGPADRIPVNVQGDAARTLAEIQGEGALTTLLPLAERGAVPLRAAVLTAVAHMPGDGVTTALAGRLKSSTSADVRAALVTTLGERRDVAAARPPVLDAVKDKDPAVRIAALHALLALGRREAVTPLVERITTDTDGVAKPAADMLARISGDQPLAAAADALNAAPPKAKVALLELLASRAARGQSAAVMKQTTDADASARQAALRAMEKLATEADAPKLVDLALSATDPAETAAALKAAVAASNQIADPMKRSAPLLARLPDARGPRRAAVERALAKVGGRAALDAVVADLQSPDPATRNGALDALAEWQDPAAVTPLLTVARETKDDGQRVTAVRGVVQVLKNAANMSPTEKAAAYREALAAAPRPEEKKMILGALGNEHGREAFDLAAATLDDPSLQVEAALAVIKTALPPAKGQPGLKGPEVVKTLEKAVTLCPDPTLKEEGARYLRILRK